MIQSKATAVLMRLKEMDRKYKIKLKENERTFSPVSAESSLENTPKSNRVTEHSNRTIVRTCLSTNEETEISSKVLPKSKMKLQIPSPRVNNVRSFDDEDVHSKISSKVSPRSVSNLEPASRSDLKVDSEIKDDVSEGSVATVFSKGMTAPETISEVIKSKDEFSSRRSEEKSNVMTDNSIDDTTIGEIISELSNVINKDDYKDEATSNVSFADEQKLEYDNDTFEDASNSTSSSSSIQVDVKKSSEELAQDTVVSGVKKIKITSHKQAESTQEKVIDDEKDKEIIELIAPKIIKDNSECDVGLDEELSNYVKTTENVDEVLPINLLKLSKQTTLTKKHVRKGRKQRKLSNENIEDSSVVSDDYERLIKANKNEGAVLKENTPPTTIKNASNEEKTRKETVNEKKVSLSGEEAQVEIEKEAMKNEKEPETVFSERLLTEIPKKSDVTSTLRELNKDAINAIIRRHRIRTTSKILDKPRYCKNCKTIVKLQSTESEAPENMKKNESKSASVEDIRKDSNYNQKVKGRRTKVKRVSKALKARKVEEKHSRFEHRQTCHLRKQAAALRMQQEREDIRNYLLELECTRLGFGPGEIMASSKFPTFKPLEFPKILAFKKPDPKDSNLSTDAFVALQEKILTTRQWLKDQYLLYRDYSKLAQTVNAKYIPDSLEDAKKTIRQLQRANESK